MGLLVHLGITDLVTRPSLQASDLSCLTLIGKISSTEKTVKDKQGPGLRRGHGQGSGSETEAHRSSASHP